MTVKKNEVRSGVIVQSPKVKLDRKIDIVARCRKLPTMPYRRTFYPHWIAGTRTAQRTLVDLTQAGRRPQLRISATSKQRPTTIKTGRIQLIRKTAKPGHHRQNPPRSRIKINHSRPWFGLMPPGELNLRERNPSMPAWCLWCRHWSGWGFVRP